MALHVAEAGLLPRIWGGRCAYKAPAPTVVVLGEQMALDHLFFEEPGGASSRALPRGQWGGLARLAQVPPPARVSTCQRVLPKPTWGLG